MEMPFKYFTFFFCFSTLLTKAQVNESSSIEGVLIDTTIHVQVEKHIEYNDQFASFGKLMEVYLNSGELQAFQDDSLTLNTKFGEKSVPFKSFYLWNGDTLIIDGAFGIFGGVGFDIKIYEGKSVLTHMLSSDDFPSYSYNPTDSLIVRLEVPCSETKIVLSELPNKDVHPTIFGYVEFKSESYYVMNGSVDGQEILPRKKLRNNMKLYFKSRFLEL